MNDTLGYHSASMTLTIKSNSFTRSRLRRWCGAWRGAMIGELLYFSRGPPLPVHCAFSFFKKDICL